MSHSLELQGIVVVIVFALSAVHFQTLLQLPLSLSGSSPSRPFQDTRRQRSNPEARRSALLKRNPNRREGTKSFATDRSGVPHRSFLNQYRVSVVKSISTFCPKSSRGMMELIKKSIEPHAHAHERTEGPVRRDERRPRRTNNVVHTRANRED